ncbi:oxidative stress defense protein [Shewanella sp. AS16]|uniref:oxidative stress defense protein n=1 Tax=Shewanella sp. AS16 TaxID=2907625 RepID=UPI001F1C61E5|nr:oxidative stress defense protein [Shewanella sp. AS16]MCE9685892.1 oxidative stress defense protein [Shewanella sp. AS16]
MKHALLAGLLTTTLATTASLVSPGLSAAELAFAHLETVGVGKVTVAPDMAEINVEVTVTEASAKAAKDASDVAVAGFIARLQAAGITKDEIQSANLNLQPQYHYEKDQPPKLSGYQASRQLTVTVKDLPRLNEILDSALEEGLNKVNNISLRSSKELEYAAKARQAAIEDAKQKAKSLAQGFELKLDGVWQIRYLEQHPVQPMMLRMAVKADYEISESYQYGKVSFEDRVEVVYRLK